MWIERSHELLLHSECMVLDWQQVGIPFRVRGYAVLVSIVNLCMCVSRWLQPISEMLGGVRPHTKPQAWLIVMYPRSAETSRASSTTLTWRWRTRRGTCWTSPATSSSAPTPSWAGSAGRTTGRSRWSPAGTTYSRSSVSSTSKCRASANKSPRKSNLAFEIIYVQHSGLIIQCMEWTIICRLAEYRFIIKSLV